MVFHTERYVCLYSDCYTRHPLSPTEGEACLSWPIWDRKHLSNQSKETCAAQGGQSSATENTHGCFLLLCGSEFAWTWENCTDRDTSQVKYTGANWKQLRRVGGEPSTFGHGSP